MIDAETIAAAIHETWRALSRSEGWQMQPRLDRPYGELAEPDKEENRAAAQGMAAILGVAGLGLTSDPGKPALTPEALKAVMESALERMAEAEHDRWMSHRARNGWSWAATRDDARKLHPSMIPYARLSESEKDKDRNNIRHYPEFAGRAGYRIVSLD